MGNGYIPGNHVESVGRRPRQSCKVFEVVSSHDEQDDVDDGNDGEKGDELLVVAPVHQAELLGQRVLDPLRHRLGLGRCGRHQPLADAANIPKSGFLSVNTFLTYL